MQALTFFFAFVAVLALIGVVAWLIRRFASNRLGANTQSREDASSGRHRCRRGRWTPAACAGSARQRRASPDDRRPDRHRRRAQYRARHARPRSIAAAAGRRQPRRSAVQPRIAPLPDPTGWGDAEAARAEPFDHAEPQMPEPPPRPSRPAFADEVRRPPRPERAAIRSPALRPNRWAAAPNRAPNRRPLRACPEASR